MVLQNEDSQELEYTNNGKPDYEETERRLLNKARKSISNNIYPVTIVNTGEPIITSSGENTTLNDFNSSKTTITINAGSYGSTSLKNLFQNNFDNNSRVRVKAVSVKRTSGNNDGNNRFGFRIYAQDTMGDAFNIINVINRYGASDVFFPLNRTDTFWTGIDNTIAYRLGNNTSIDPTIESFVFTDLAYSFASGSVDLIIRIESSITANFEITMLVEEI